MRKGITILGILILIIGLIMAGIYGLALAVANAAIASGNAVPGSTYGDAVGLTVFGVILFVIGLIITIIGIRGDKNTATSVKVK